MPPAGLSPVATVHLARRARAVSMPAGLLAREVAGARALTACSRLLISLMETMAFRAQAHRLQLRGQPRSNRLPALSQGRHRAFPFKPLRATSIFSLCKWFFGHGEALTGRRSRCP